jgi:hypothetical protein
VGEGERLRGRLRRGILRKKDGMEKVGQEIRRRGRTIRQTEEGQWNGKGRTGDCGEDRGG